MSKKLNKPVTKDKLNEIKKDKETKKKLRSLLKKRGWTKKDINEAILELWPES